MDIIVRRNMRVSGVDYVGGNTYTVTDTVGQTMIGNAFADSAYPFDYYEPSQIVTIPRGLSDRDLRRLIEASPAYSTLSFAGGSTSYISSVIKYKEGMRFHLNGATLKRRDMVTVAVSADPTGLAVIPCSADPYAAGFRVGQDVSIQTTNGASWTFAWYRILNISGLNVTLNAPFAFSNGSYSAGITSMYLASNMFACAESYLLGGNATLETSADNVVWRDGYIDGNRAGNPIPKPLDILCHSIHHIGSYGNFTEMQISNAIADGLVLSGIGNSVGGGGMRIDNSGGNAIHLSDCDTLRSSAFYGSWKGIRDTYIHDLSIDTSNLYNTTHSGGCIEFSVNIRNTVIDNVNMTNGAITALGGIGDITNSKIVMKNCRISKMGFGADISWLTDPKLAGGFSTWQQGVTQLEQSNHIELYDNKFISNAISSVWGTSGTNLSKRLILKRNQWINSPVQMRYVDSIELGGNRYTNSGLSQICLNLDSMTNLIATDEVVKGGGTGLYVNLHNDPLVTDIDFAGFNCIDQYQFGMRFTSTASMNQATVNNPRVRTRSATMECFIDRDLGSKDAWFTSTGAALTGVENSVLMPAWSSSTAYVLNDVVSINGSNYICVQASTNQTPINNMLYWVGLAGACYATFDGTAGQALWQIGIIPPNLPSTLTFVIDSFNDSANPGGLIHAVIDKGDGTLGTVINATTGNGSKSLSMGAMSGATDRCFIKIYADTGVKFNLYAPSLTVSSANMPHPTYAGINSVTPGMHIANPDVYITGGAVGTIGINLTSTATGSIVKGGRVNVPYVGIQAAAPVDIQDINVKTTANSASAIGVSLLSGASAAVVSGSTIRSVGSGETIKIAAGVVSAVMANNCTNKAANDAGTTTVNTNTQAIV